MMYASKLMMQAAKPLGYVEDDSLLRKVENDSFGSFINIPNVRNGTNSFTYCGTLPTAENGAIVTQKTMLSIWRYSFDLYISSRAALILRNASNGAGIKPISHEDFKWWTMSNTDMQPYVAFTLHFPTETSQKMSLQYEDSEKVLFEGNWAHQNYNYVYTQVADGNKVIDLGLVYNRVLTEAELEQNYRAFLQKHR